MLQRVTTMEVQSLDNRSVFSSSFSEHLRLRSLRISCILYHLSFLLALILGIINSFNGTEYP